MVEASFRRLGPHKKKCNWQLHIEHSYLSIIDCFSCKCECNYKTKIIQKIHWVIIDFLCCKWRVVTVFYVESLMRACYLFFYLFFLNWVFLEQLNGRSSAEDVLFRIKRQEMLSWMVISLLCERWVSVWNWLNNVNTIRMGRPWTTKYIMVTYKKRNLSPTTK